MKSLPRSDIQRRWKRKSGNGDQEGVAQWAMAQQSPSDILVVVSCLCFVCGVWLRARPDCAPVEIDLAGLALARAHTVEEGTREKKELVGTTRLIDCYFRRPHLHT
jgi:hypothetical protein